MDLRTIKEDLRGGNIEDPISFAKDVRLIFQNSRSYNTNKRSRVSVSPYYLRYKSSVDFHFYVRSIFLFSKLAKGFSS
jgi:bromodomain and WD repeat domain containing protein 1/3